MPHCAYHACHLLACCAGVRSILTGLLSAAAASLLQEVQSLMFELSMWRASDELHAYAVRRSPSVTLSASKQPAFPPKNN